jgi:hypothetical protein
MKVCDIYFVHGTFLGHDPLGLYKVLGKSESILEHSLTKRSLRDRLLGDRGNFLDSYIQLFQDALKADIPCHHFRWTSENHHAARLRAALGLIHSVAEEISKKGYFSQGTGQRILLIGHSHGAQLFALLSHLHFQTDLGLTILEILKEADPDALEVLRGDLEKIKDLTFDIVTLGTPFLYPWPEKAGRRLLHVVNFRGEPIDTLNDIHALKRGKADLVQKIGILGTDFLAADRKDRQLNRLLDTILGKGVDMLRWSIKLRQSAPTSPIGTTIFVDYSPLRDNKHHTDFNDIFGHGVYTRFDCMAFQTQLILKYLYEK